MNSQTASACAKFLISGEHSVLYGGPALGAAIKNKQLVLNEYSDGPGQGLIVNGNQLDEGSFQKVLSARSAITETASPKAIQIESDIPLGAGLGSSAALCIAMSRLHSPAGSSVETIFKKALAGEKTFHGNPSGVDPATIAHERAIYYSMSDEIKFLDLRMYQDSDFKFVLVDSGLRHQTAKVIRNVESLKTSKPGIFDKTISYLKALSFETKEVLERNCDLLGPLMNEVHEGLVQLGVSNLQIENLRGRLESLGAKGSKISGAGCGGHVLALFHKEDLPLLTAQKDFSFFVPELS